MIRKIMHDMKKPYIVLLALFLCIVIAGSVFAAYTSINTAKRVLSTMPDSDMLFSSNYLREPNVDNTYINRSIQFVNDQQNPTIFVSVCNYAQGVKSKWCEKDINYSFKVTLVDENGNAILSENNYTIPGREGQVSGSDILNSNAYSVKKNDETTENILSNGIYESSNETLSPDTAQKNVYAIKINKDYMSIVKIKVEAIASDNSPAYKNEKLAAYLVTSVYSNVVQAGWSGKFVDNDGSDNTSSKNYSGFNYDIEGSGEGTIVLTWDESKVTISQRFLKDIKDLLIDSYKTSGPVDDGGKKKIEFNVGGADCPDNFRVQFYRMAAPADEENWTTVASYVSIDYKAKAEGGEQND